MSKMGISTLASYTGAQLFQVIGIGQATVDRFFTGLEQPARRHRPRQDRRRRRRPARTAFTDRPTELAPRTPRSAANTSGAREGEYHLFNRTPCSSAKTHPHRPVLVFQGYTKMVDDQTQQLGTLRGLFDFNFGDRDPIPIDKVEPASGRS